MKAEGNSYLSCFVIKQEIFLYKKKRIGPFKNQRDYPFFSLIWIYVLSYPNGKRNNTTHIRKDFVSGIWDFVTDPVEKI